MRGGRRKDEANVEPDEDGRCARCDDGQGPPINAIGREIGQLRRVRNPLKFRSANLRIGNDHQFADETFGHEIRLGAVQV